MQAELVWPIGAMLGEGPLWAEDEGALYFTDIEGRSIHRFHPATGERQSWPVEGRPGFIVRDTAGQCLVGIEKSVRRFRDGELGPAVATVDTPDGTRLNDATVGPDGRLWFGSMDAACSEPVGQVHVLDHPAPPRSVGGHCAITNGPAVSADNRTLYHVDTKARLIWAFDIAARDQLEDGRLHIEIETDAGAPDGVVLDSENCLWVALWGGWGVRRYDPDGQLMQFVPLPASQITKVAFGGPDFRTSYVTSARQQLSPAQLAAEPDAGGLFAFEAPAPGLPANRLRAS